MRKNVSLWAGRAAFLVIGTFTILRLVVAPSFGLGVDEAHYVLYARNLDLSYVDHPPLVGWTHWPLYLLFGQTELLARLPAILLFAVTSFLAYRYTVLFSGSYYLALLALLAINSSFILNVMGLMLLPDCFLLALIFPLMTVVKNLAERGRFSDFASLGIILGTAGLAKYTAILFVPPIVGYFIIKKRWRLLFSPSMFFAAAVALVMISPVIIWNLRHDFVSFKYQTGHVLAATTPSLKSFLVSLLAQCGAYSPFLFVVAFYGFFKSWRERNDYLLLACLFGGTILVFFLYGSLYERTLPHWPSLFYLLFIPAGVYHLFIGGSRAKRNFLYISIGFSLTVTLFLYGEIQAKWFRFPDYKSPFRDIYGFAEVSREAAAILAGDPAPQKAVAVTNWTMGSRMAYYLPPPWRSYVVDRRFDQFDLWEGPPPLGLDLLFVNTHFHNEDIAKTFLCDDCQLVKRRDIVLNGGKVDTVEYVWCRNFGGYRP
ncbi:MAG: glycosyltransferase family 39 protein [Syntrophales bacterium]|nr:glycosyltransferase family 39 protein [Syntrophales bacterium]